MSNVTMFNALVRQLLIQLDDNASDIIVNSLNTKKKIKVLRALAFGDKTSHQLQEATGIKEGTLPRVIQQLVTTGVVEVKGTISNRRRQAGGKDANLWGLA